MAAAVLNGSINVGDVNQDGLLDTDEVWEFTASHVAATGAYTSASSVSATDSGLGLSVGDAAMSSYFGVASNVALEASSTGYGFDDQGRTLVASGDLIETSYLVSNTGNDPLSGVQVLSNSVVAAAVLNGSTNVGDVNQDGLLDTDEVWEFTASHVAATGTYTSVSSVSATDSGLGLSVGDVASSTYFGVAPNVALEAYLLDEDGNPLEDLVVSVGEEVHFLYRVINTGNIHLDALELAGASSVLDGPCNVGDLDCDGLLDTDEVWKYESRGTAILGEQSNAVVVTASAETSSQIVQSTVESTYIGEYRDLVVTHSGDSGVGSLRYVIEDALSRPHGGNITFAIPETDPSFADASSSFVIQPLSPLPTLDGPSGIWIDGLQGGQDFDAGVFAPQIIIDGSLAGEASGLELFSDNNGVRGIGIQNFQGAGIHINGSGNTVARNYIGVDAQGDDAGNRDDGIWIEAGSNNMVGALEEDPQNVIAYNGGNGISVTAGTGNVIAANEFFDNFAMSIDLGNDGLTSNDVAVGLVDADVGANDRLNTPVITRIEVVGNLVEVDYSVPTNADALQEPLRIEFFLADESRREGEVFLGTDEYTHEDFLQGGKTLQVELEDLPSRVIPVVATATSFEGNTSEFSAPRGVSFVGRTVESQVLEIADDVTGGIQNALEQWIADPSDVPIWDLAPPTEEIVFDDPVIDAIFIGRGAVAGDASDHAIDLGNSDDPLIAVGFGQSVDNVTMAVNNYCTEQFVAMCDSLELVVGQMVACIWFDPINFSVSIGGNEVSYDYDTNPSAIVGSIPGASLVVTPSSQSTPGGVQAIMFAGDSSNINIQMSTTNSGALMRGGVNVYTVGSGSGGPTIQPTIRSAFQGYLPSDTIAMSFDPSQPSFASSGMSGAIGQAFMNSRGASSDSQVSGRSGGGGGGGGGGGVMPLSIGGDFARPGLFAIAALDPAGLINSNLDISGSIAGEDQEGEVNALGNELDQLEDDDITARDDEEESVPAEEEDNLDTDEFDGEGEVLPEDEEELDEAISVIFDLIGESLASDSGHIDVIEILESDSRSSDHNQIPDVPVHDQVWKTSDFSVISIDEARAMTVARAEPVGEGKVLTV